MNRLFRVLHRWKCKNAPQKVALDALRHCEDARWAGLFLWHVESYLRGVDAPEAEFRDFTNHVYYPIEKWGGAPRLARKWYWKTVEALRARDWDEAAYAAGAMTRYVGFAFSPSRTGHGDAAFVVRRPAEWCVSRLYDPMTAAAGEQKPVRVPEGEDWLERLVASAAEDAYCHFRAVTDKFDADAVLAKPAALDPELQTIFGGLLVRAAAVTGEILRRAVAEAGASPPRYFIGPAGLLALPSLPLFWWTRSRSQASERRSVKATQRAITALGPADEALPEDARAVRDAYEVEVLKKSARKDGAAAKTADAGRTPKSDPREKPASVTASKAAPSESTPAPAPRSASPERTRVPADATSKGDAPKQLTVASPVGLVPSIDPKFIPRLRSTGITTIGDLLKASPEKVAASLHPAVTSADVSAWQDQVRLACSVASLTLAEAQLLVACGVTGPDDLAALSPIELWELVIPVAESPDGRRLLRGAAAPNLDAVTRWIASAKQGRKAA